MPIIYYNVSPMASTSKEPYITLTRRFKRIEHHLDGQEIEIGLAGKEGFSKGFYSDSVFLRDPLLRFIFADAGSGQNSTAQPVFVRMAFSFECNEKNFFYYQPQIQALKKRYEYFFIPLVSHLGFEAQLDERFNMNFDVVVPNAKDVLTVCYCLINLIIAILCFEN